MAFIRPDYHQLHYDMICIDTSIHSCDATIIMIQLSTIKYTDI